MSAADWWQLLSLGAFALLVEMHIRNPRRA